MKMQITPEWLENKIETTEGDETCEVGLFDLSEQTLTLANAVADMPAAKNDKASIDAWARRLALDISKGND